MSIRYDTILYENDTITETVQKIRYDTKIYEFNTITMIRKEFKYISTKRDKQSETEYSLCSG